MLLNFSMMGKTTKYEKKLLVLVAFSRTFSGFSFIKSLFGSQNFERIEETNNRFNQKCKRK